MSEKMLKLPLGSKSRL